MFSFKFLAQFLIAFIDSIAPSSWNTGRNAKAWTNIVSIHQTMITNKRLLLRSYWFYLFCAMTQFQSVKGLHILSHFPSLSHTLAVPNSTFWKFFVWSWNSLFKCGMASTLCLILVLYHIYKTTFSHQDHWILIGSMNLTDVYAF